MRPDDPRTPLTESQPIPAEQVGRLADQAIGHYEELTRDGDPAGEALWPPADDRAAAERAAAMAVADFERSTTSEEWTVLSSRIRQLAADAIGLYVEGYTYDYDRDQAHAAAVLECLQGEAARAEIPPPDLAVLAAASRTPHIEPVTRTRDGGER
jgi:hypothetical protein